MAKDYLIIIRKIKKMEEIFRILLTSYFYPLRKEIEENLKKKMLEIISEENDFNEGVDDLESYLYRIAEKNRWLAKED